MADYILPLERVAARRSVLRVAGLWTVVAAAWMVPPEPVHAQDLSVRATAAERVVADDNIRLEEDSRGWVFGSTTSLGLDVDSRSPLVGINLDLGADYNHFVGPGADSDLDSLDWRAGLGLDRRFLRGEVGARVEYRRQAVRESELEDTGATEADDAERESILGRVTAAYDVSSVDRVDGTVEVRDVSFNQDQQSDLRNPFQSVSATARWARELTPRDTGTAILRSIYFDADDRFQTTSQSYSIGALYEQRATPRLTWFAGAAVGVVDEERDTSGGGRDSSLSPALNLDVGGSYTLERVLIELALSQGLEPSATGRLRQQRLLRANLEYQATSDTVVSLTAFNVSQRADTEFTLFDEYDREFTTVEARIAWLLLPDLRFTTGYRFRHDDTGDGATSNAVFATLSYGFSLLP